MMLDKKQIWAIFLFEFKMGCKAAVTNCNIINNNMNINNNWLWNYKWMYSAVVVEEVCKGNESFENEEHSGWPLEVNNDQLRGSSELILLQLHEKLLKNSTLTALQLFSIWSKLERWKSSISECLMSWLQILKTVILKCLLLFYATTMNQFSIGFWCATKCILYNNIQWAAHFPKPNLCQEKVMVTVWWSAAGLIYYSFLNPGEIITSEKYAQQIDEMHWNL